MRHHDPGNLYIQFEVEFPTAAPVLSSIFERETLKKFTGLPHMSEKELQAIFQIEQLKAQEKKAREEGTLEQAQDGMILDENESVEELQPITEELDPNYISYHPIPARVPNPTAPDDRTKDLLVIREDHVLEEVDQSSQRRANGATMEDEEDDGMPSGGERVQCASQ